MNYVVEDFIEVANATSNRECLFDLYMHTIKTFGFGFAHYGLVTDHLEAGQQAGLGVFTNFPSDWMSYYFEKGYDLIDPIAENVTYTNNVFTWGEVKENEGISSQQRLIVNLAEESGLLSGFCIPLHGARGEIAGMGVACDSKNHEFTNLELSQVQIITQQFHQKYCSFGTPLERESPMLTIKERDVLQWMAAGKAVFDISVIMNISEDTVKFHKKNIYTKLNANSQVYAIVKSLRLGLISLDKLAIA